MGVVVAQIDIEETEGVQYRLAEMDSTAETTTTLMVLSAFEHIIYNNNLTKVQKNER